MQNKSINLNGIQRVLKVGSALAGRLSHRRCKYPAPHFTRTAFCLRPVLASNERNFNYSAPLVYSPVSLTTF